ncbi:retrotransposon protein, putative, ty1-copia subclass [Tanacetum coccineum]
MKNYVKLECLGYVLPQELSVGYLEWPHTKIKLSMGKTVGELHVLLIEYEKGLPKKAETPQVMMIKGDKIQKSNKKSLKAKDHPVKDEPATTKKRWVIVEDCLLTLMKLIKKIKASWHASSSFSKNNVHYFNVIPSNGIYEIDMHNLVPNVNSIYNVSTKRAKHNLDSTYLWHCRLAHISKKRIEKLQQEGLLKSTDDESLINGVSLSVLSAQIHVSRQGASYFITFTDDYSRYGYVYLLKHKHEVFETFKVFKNEVENQLGKTIKALRSDRGGEYISLEFKDYLKACGIVQQLTPPYTPQHNRVSERRNRTLLDMVRSMMNLTTLPLAFWDYALESATRILNMVPTKKVDKTLYELRYGKVPNLSYLKLWGCEVLMKRDTPDKLQQRSIKHAEFFEKNLITQEVSERAIEEEISIRRSERKRRAPNRLCLNIEAEEHSLGDLNKPTSYKAAMLDSESNKWIDAMNAEIQSMMDNMKVCKLQRSINGLKKASRSWNKRFDKETKKFGFDQNLDELCVYQKASGSNVTFLILYVNDIIIMGNHIPSLQSVNDYLGKYKMDNSKRGHIPMQERLDLNKTQGASTPEEVKRMQNVPYTSAVGSIMYVVRCTRPDVAFAQNITSRFQQSPGESHWSAMKNILKYLRITKDMFLVYGGNPKAELRVDCYCDTGFETDIDDMKSLTGYVSF